MRLPVLSASAAAPILPASDIARALVQGVRGQVRLSAHDRMLYATDASLYQVEPLAVVIPADVDDAADAVATCNQLDVPVLPRGGGTSLAGQCTNRAVVIDVSPTCRKIVGVDAARKFACVEPGLTVDDFNDAIAATGLFFAADPATARHASFGGCIGNNAAGSRSVLYGRTSESIEAIGGVLASGERVWFGPSRFDGSDVGSSALLGSAAPTEQAIMRGKHLAREVSAIVRAHANEILARFPKTIRRNAGYGLDMVLMQLDAGVADEDVNLSPMLCGSEGTLAFTLHAVLKLQPRPKAKALAVLGFAELDHAIASVIALLATKPSAIELLDDLIVSLARANTEYSKYVELMPPPPAAYDGAKSQLKAVLYVEYFASSEAELAERIALLRDVVRTLPKGQGCSVEVHTHAAAMTNAWKLRKAGEPLLHGVSGTRKPITFVEDNAIPVANLATFVKELRKLVEAEGTTAAFYAHASVGVLHVRPLIDIHDEADRDRMRRIAVATADLAQSLGGVMSGEHGDGRIRGPLLERFYGKRIMEAFTQIKRVFDPRNVLNPGNIVDLSGLDARPVESMTRSLRVEPQPRRPASTPTDLVTHFDYSDQHGIDGAVEMCNGAGVCRKQQGGTMCPSYQATLDERHSTRGRGNALRLAMTGQMPGGIERAFYDEETRETLHLCLSCKACKTECPSNVDISRLKAEYTAQRYAREGGAPLSARVMGNVRTLNKLGALAPAIANRVNALSPMRAVINKLLDVHPQRSLPKFSTSLASLWHGYDKTSAKLDAPAVALFGDCFTMYNESQIGLAIRRVYEGCGYRVVLVDAGCCGRAQISLGVLDEARSTVDATIAKLQAAASDPSIRAIIVAEPSCLSAIKDDWLQLKLSTPIEVRRLIASKSFLPEQFLHTHWDKHPVRPTFHPPQVPVVLHGHCHQRALWGAASSGAMLERAAPGKVKVLDSGCCGMAGSFGYTTDRFELSQKIGELVLFPAVREAQARDGSQVCIAAPGTSCRHQLHDATAVDAKHPMELLAAWLHT